VYLKLCNSPRCQEPFPYSIMQGVGTIWDPTYATGTGRHHASRDDSEQRSLKDADFSYFPCPVIIPKLEVYGITDLFRNQ